MTAVELAALADDVRRDVPSLDAMLPDDRADDREMLALSAAYVDRASRIAWGVMLFVPVAAILVLLGVQAITLWVPETAYEWHYIEWGIHPSWWLLELDEPRYAVFAICVAAIVASFARRYAAARFANHVDGPEPVVLGRAMLARIEPWFVAWWTIGVVAFLGFVATVIIFDVSELVYYASWNELGRGDLRFSLAVHHATTSRIRDLWIMVPCVVAAAIWISRRPVAWLRTRVVAWSGFAVTWAALAGALAVSRCDEGAYTEPPDNVLRTTIIVAGFVGLLALVSSFALRRGDSK